MVMRNKKLVHYTSAPVKEKDKKGSYVVVSRALVKPGSSNLIPKIHVRRGDTVIVISGSEKAGKGKIAKVINVFPQTGKIIVEGVNMVTRATRKRSATGQSGLIKKEAPIFASKVMLYDTDKKKPIRASKRKLLGL